MHGPCPLTNLSAAADKGESLSASKAAEDAQQALQLDEADLPVKKEEKQSDKVKGEDHGIKYEESGDGIKDEVDVKEEVADSKNGIKAEAPKVEVKEEPNERPKRRRTAKSKA